MRFILALCVVGGFFCATESRAELVDFLPAAPAIHGGDFNLNGAVTHADYAILGDNYGASISLPNELSSPGMVDVQDFNDYRASYGTMASISHASSGLGFTITSAATMGGNVEWTFKFSNVDGAMAGHLSIQVDGGLSAPNIVSINAGTVNHSSFTQSVPGIKTFNWLAEVDQDPGAGTNNRPQGVQHNNANHQAYGALGTHLGSSFTDATLTFLTLVTQGQQTTTLRVIGGQNNADRSEYGYRPNLGVYEDFYFPQDQIATFTAAVPEGSVVLFWSCLAAAAVGVRFFRARER